MELTKNILDNVFEITRKFASKQITLSQARDVLVRNHNFNENSAAMTIRSLCHLLNGERYRRALTVASTDYFLSRISEEDGQEGLRLALQGLSLHIEYRKKDTGVNVPGLECVLYKYSK